MLSRLSQVLNAADDVSTNGAALIGFYGRNMRRDDRRNGAMAHSSHQRIHRRAPATL